MQEGVQGRIDTTYAKLPEALLAFEAQIVILTATVQPHSLPLYQTQFGRDDFNVIREPSDRPDVAFHLVPTYVRTTSEPYNGEDIVLNLTTSLTHHIEQSPTPTDRILVFFPDRSSVQSFAEAHGYLWSHSHCSKDHLTESLASWDRLDCRVLVGTTAFAQGLDRESIRYVITANVTYGITTVAQMMGRAGRDGVPSDMFFIGPKKAPLDVSISWRSDSMLAQHHLNATSGCQREVMITALDGPSKTYQCFTAGFAVHPCGNCAPKAPLHLLALQAVETARQAYVARSRRATIPSKLVASASQNLSSHQATSTRSSQFSFSGDSSSIASWSSPVIAPAKVCLSIVSSIVSFANITSEVQIFNDFNANLLRLFQWIVGTINATQVR